MPVIYSNSFVPAWWLSNPHLQTLWPALLRQGPNIERNREQLDTPDGDFVDLDWTDAETGPLVLLLHGLSGSSRSSYILGMQSALRSCGMDSVALNFRGCGGDPNRTARCYHSGDTDDLNYLYSVLTARFPGRPIAAVGFSLGGNVLLKWLGEQGSEVKLFGAAAVSVPMLLDRCADRLDAGLSKIYRDRLLKELKDYVRIKREHLREFGPVDEFRKLANLGELDPIRSFWEYDDRVVATLYGFNGVHDYYRRCSARPYLKQVRCPALIVHAQDDPFMSPDVIPTADELSCTVLLEVCRAGGHVGFIAGSQLCQPCYWLEQRIPQFLSQQLE
ncbi:hydrolase [Methyloterricola oryzae]|uniref:hydrolase n=1 Tax=Methyloterricola oryzae TaxID=1495050 RepID=UPI0005EB273F|nr:hydrolase [Methyloterricola oryzae]